MIGLKVWMGGVDGGGEKVGLHKQCGEIQR